jgi:hypothetical protein
MTAWRRGLPMLAVSGLISGWIGMAEGQLLGPKATCIQEAVRFVVSKTPAIYYRHGTGGETAAAATAPVAVAAGSGVGATTVVATAPTDSTGGPPPPSG